jgi:hypothetical protein
MEKEIYSAMRIVVRPLTTVTELHEVKSCFTNYDYLIPVKLLITSIKRYNSEAIHQRNAVTTGQETNKLLSIWTGVVTTKRFTVQTATAGPFHVPEYSMSRFKLLLS